jgi:two-component system, OmpR family, phosphate regulon response regulator PhoB
MATVLLVDDEPDLLTTLSFNLRREGYDVRLAETGQQALDRAFEGGVPALMVLDWMLPDMSGVELCRRFRQDARTAKTPILMLTARGDERDRVQGLETGADDYVVKPYSVRELLLRIRALLRRAEPEQPESAARQVGELRLDSEAHRAWVGDQEVTLTLLEFRLLETLLSRRGRVQTRERLLEEVWHVPGELTTRTVDTHVKRLRQKLGSAGRFVETVRGVGYRFGDGDAS